jgi:hypothetical protein
MTPMAHYRDRLSDARFHSRRPGDAPLPSAWPDVRAQLAPVSAMDRASVPAQATAGEMR